MGLSSNLVSSKFDGKSFQDISQLLNKTETENSRVQTETIEPLRRKITEFSRSKGFKTANIDRNISSLREKVTTTRTSLLLKEQSVVTLKNKTEQATNDMRVTAYNYTNIVNATYHGLLQMLSNTKDKVKSSPTTPEDKAGRKAPVSMHLETLSNKGRIVCIDSNGVLLDVVDLPYLQAVRDACMTDLASIRVRLDAANKALKNLQDTHVTLIPDTVQGPGVTLGASQVRSGTNSTDSTNIAPSTVCAAHKAEECPTCGQTLSSSARTEREREVNITVTSLLLELRVVEACSADLNKRIEQGQSARNLYQKWHDLNDRSKDVLDEVTQAGKLILKMKEDEKVFNSELDRQILEKREIEENDSIIENQNNIALEESLDKLKNSTLLEKKLRMDVDEVWFLHPSWGPQLLYSSSTHSFLDS
jgi:transcription elongation factor Elf1